jgi:hypothetical protein
LSPSPILSIYTASQKRRTPDPHRYCAHCLKSIPEYTLITPTAEEHLDGSVEQTTQGEPANPHLPVAAMPGRGVPQPDMTCCLQSYFFKLAFSVFISSLVIGLNLPSPQEGPAWNPGPILSSTVITSMSHNSLVEVRYMIDSFSRSPLQA